jgi:membrane protein YdbS with pleckstrin-like domain
MNFNFFCLIQNIFKYILYCIILMEGINWKILDPATKKVWRVKGTVVFGLIWLLTSVSTFLGWFYTPVSDPNRYITIWVFIIATIFLLIIFIIYNLWIIMYYPRYSYALGKEGILINRGIWWKYKRTIPYSRIQHISIDQGPFEQIFKIYRVNSYTAGTGSMGGASAGSNITGPEGQILGVKNPEPMKEEIMKYVMESRLGNGITDIKSSSVSTEILEELRAIRKNLEK